MVVCLVASLSASAFALSEEGGKDETAQSAAQKAIQKSIEDARQGKGSVDGQLSDTRNVSDKFNQKLNDKKALDAAKASGDVAEKNIKDVFQGIGGKLKAKDVIDLTIARALERNKEALKLGISSSLKNLKGLDLTVPGMDSIARIISASPSSIDFLVKTANAVADGQTVKDTKFITELAVLVATADESEMKAYDSKSSIDTMAGIYRSYRATEDSAAIETEAQGLKYIAAHKLINKGVSLSASVEPGFKAFLQYNIGLSPEDAATKAKNMKICLLPMAA
jgi:hypothetical protein